MSNNLVKAYAARTVQRALADLRAKGRATILTLDWETNGVVFDYFRARGFEVSYRPSYSGIPTILIEKNSAKN